MFMLEETVDRDGSKRKEAIPHSDALIFNLEKLILFQVLYPKDETT